MTAAVYGARKMMKLAILTKDFGGQISSTSEIENYMGFQTISGEELAKKFREQVELFEVPVRTGATVTEVRKHESDAVFAVTTDDSTVYRAQTVVLATGKRSRKLNVPGEKELAGRGVAYCATCDAPFYKGKQVVVAGGGNSAATAALDLIKVAKHVSLVNFVSGWQADEIMMQTLRRSDRVKLYDYHQVVRIHGEQRVTGVTIKNREDDAEIEIPAQGIFVEIGLLPNSEPVMGHVETTSQKEVIIDCFARTSVPGLFGAGDVTTVPYKQIVVSAGEGAKAALSAYSYLVQKGAI
jgi:alkyl hydroperoxide reductase subunit F